MHTLRRFAPPLVGLGIILLAWELWPLLTDFPPYIAPRFSDVISEVARSYSTLLSATWLTTIRSLTGLLLSIVTGVGGALLLGLSKNLERTLFPYAIVLQTTPTIIIAPIAVIWIGPGFWAIVVVSLIICFFPMLSNTLIGLNSVDPETRSLFEIYGASRLQTMRKLRLPGSTPFIMAGVRISAGLSVIGAIVGEFVVGAGGPDGGLGAVIVHAAQQFRVPFLMSAALVGGSLGILYYLGARQLSRKILSWHESMAPANTGGNSKSSKRSGFGK